MMGKFVKVTIKGEMFKGDKLALSINAMLADIGSASAHAMKEITHKSDVSNRLSDSITWQMSDRGSNAFGEHKSEDKIDKPSESGVLLVGSGAPHAFYRDTYSGVHTSSDGSEEFIDSLNEWAEKVLGIGRDNPDPDKQYRFWCLVKAIRDGITPGEAFIDPTIAKVPNFASSAFKRASKLAVGKVKEK